MGAGVALIVAGSLVGLIVVFVLWRRLAPAVALALLAGCGVAVGAGGLLVQDVVTAAEWTLTLVALGVLAPLHARLVFGLPGRRA
jgi:hypothetical protein